MGINCQVHTFALPGEKWLKVAHSRWSWRGPKFFPEGYFHGGEKYSLAFSMAAPVLASSAMYCYLGEVICPIEASVFSYIK